MKLMLCAGAGRRHGWRTLDSSTEHGPDFLASIPPLPPAVMGEKWEEIEWIHGVTSLYPWDAITVLSQCRSILSPGGKIVLEQPDARIAAGRVLEDGNPQWLFGDPSHQTPGIMNRWAYTPETLFELLKGVGFKLIELRSAEHHVPSRDFRMVAFA